MNEDAIPRFDPGFLEPIWLAVGLLAVLAVVLLEIGAARRRKHAARLFAASHLLATLAGSVSLPKRLLKRGLLLTAVALLFIALARPHLYSGWRMENRTGVDILLAVDCSRSMLTEDVHPSRLERAKLAIADFAARLPDDRLGLIAFAGDAFLQCPLTLDHDAFDSAVRELDTDTIPRPGTDIASAIDQAVLALKSQPNNMKFLILVTDGEDLEGRALASAKAAGEAGLKIFTIGVGTPAGGLIPMHDESGAIAYLHDSSGQIVQSRLDESALRQIAQSTGGAYLPLGQSGEGLDRIYQRYIATLPKANLQERKERVYLELFAWPLGLAILLLALEFLISERAGSTRALAHVEPPRRRPGVRPSRKTAAVALLIVGLCWLGAAGTTFAASTDLAERDYKAGKYDDALEKYREAAQAQPDRPDLNFNTGDAAYKAGAYDDAEQSYRKALDTPDLDLQEKTYYNLGNTQFKHGEAMEKLDQKKTVDLWQRALNSYSSALKLKDAADTRHNYSVVKARLEQLKQQQKQDNEKKSGQPSGNPSQDKNSSPDSKSNDGKSSDGQSPDQQSQGKPGENQAQGSSQQQQQSGQDQGQAKQDEAGKDKTASGAGTHGTDQQRAQSAARQQDNEDPGVRSRREAEALLDSLKDDEQHVNARALNGNQETPPPASGKDW
jgi:Ca-activated chloride channel family protein